MMSDLVAVAADALLPFLAAGAGAVGAGAADQAGADLYKSATGVLGKLGKRLRGVGKADIEATIREALEEGLVTRSDLERLQTAYLLARNNSSIVVGKVDADTSFVGNTKIGKLNIGRRE
jgi:hypothetical protein